MNTFLPFPSFAESAMALDDKRLGKQRLEARQFLDTLLGRSDAWKEHPACRMWAGFESALCRYGMTVCAEFKRRGFKDRMFDEFKRLLTLLPSSGDPPWLGRADIHSSHRANLVRKDPTFYKIVKGFEEEPREGYVWPS